MDWLARTAPCHKLPGRVRMASTMISFMREGEMKNIVESRLTVLKNCEGRAPPLIVLAKDLFSLTNGRE